MDAYMNKVLHQPEASFSLPDIQRRQHETKKKKKNRFFLSFLSSCFRYFRILQGAGIINHCERRWQSQSIVAKEV